MRKLVSLPLFLVLIAAWCDEDNLTKIAQGLNSATTALQTVQNTVKNAFFAGVIEKTDADAYVKISVDVAAAIQLANDRTRAFSELPPEGRDEILEILVPVIETLAEGLTDEKLGIISDDDLRSKVKFGLTTALTGLKTAQALLGVQ